MIQRIKSGDRHFTDIGWLKTYWLFSFSDYYDPDNLQHGMLRVFNDDIVEPRTGFGKHPHEEMEIISIVLDGEMVHKDTMGNECIIRKNDVQRMTAGKGLYHSEKNKSDKRVHFFQIWILPDKNNLTPSYDQKSFHPDSWKNNLTLLAAKHAGKEAVSLNTDGAVYRSELAEGSAVTHTTKAGRKLFIYVIEGEVNINGQKFEAKDQARIHNLQAVEIHGNTPADFLLIDVADNSSLK